jgi:hypothetical protein
MTLFRAAGAALLVLSAAACKKEQPEQELNPAPVTARPDILKEIPIIAASRQIDTTGSSDAERNTWTVRAPFDSVLAYYRRLLPTMGWSVMSDQGDSLETNLYLRKSTYALWVHVERRAEDTMYMLITSMADSTTPVMPTPR